MDNKEKFKMQCHLLGEAFPGQFTITIAIGKNEDGTLKDKCDVICNPQNEQEVEKVKNFLYMLSGGMPLS